MRSIQYFFAYRKYVPYSIFGNNMVFCHKSYIYGFMISSKDDGIPVIAFLVLYCTKCKNIYIAKYISTSGTFNLKLDFVLLKLTPNNHIIDFLVSSGNPSIFANSSCILS